MHQRKMSSWTVRDDECDSDNYFGFRLYRYSSSPGESLSQLGVSNVKAMAYPP